MILRKPYAFLAKHFKKIHFILTILVAYLVYRTDLLFNFFNSAVTNQNTVGQDLVSSLFNIFMFLIPLLWIILSLIILSLMWNKKKPFTFYVINIAMAIGILILYTYSRDLVLTMEVRLADIRVIRAMRDVIMGVLLTQVVVTIMVGVRATGFDIKKFNFGADLSGIDVEEEDREEFEVNFELDTDKTKRDLKRNLRYAKYVYVENKYLINLVAGILSIVLVFVIFMNTMVYHKTYKPSNYFSIAGLSMRVKSAYVVTTDYKGSSITEEGTSLVILSLDVKKLSSTVKKTLDTASAVLILNNHKYYHNKSYRDKLIDLGKSYDLEELTTDYTNYLLVYEVPTSSINKKSKFEFTDKNTIGVGLDLQSVTVNLTLQNLESNTKEETLSLEKEETLKKSILNTTTIEIDSTEISSQFVNTYKYCPKTNECYTSTEYIKPSIVNNYDKTLLKITGNLNLNENTLLGVSDLYDFISTFGTLKYKINGEEKTQNISFKEVTPTKNKKKNVYYLEVLKEVENAEEISLSLKIRNVTYTYKIK